MADGSTKKSPSPSPPTTFLYFLPFQHASPSAQISRRRPCSQCGSQIHLVNEIYPAGYRTPDGNGTPRFGLIGSLPRHPKFPMSRASSLSLLLDSVAIFLLPSSHRHRRGALEVEGVDADGLALQLESAGHAHACFLPPQ